MVFKILPAEVEKGVDLMAREPFDKSRLDSDSVYNDSVYNDAHAS